MLLLSVYCSCSFKQCLQLFYILQGKDVWTIEVETVLLQRLSLTPLLLSLVHVCPPCLMYCTLPMADYHLVTYYVSAPEKSLYQFSTYVSYLHILHHYLKEWVHHLYCLPKGPSSQIWPTELHNQLCCPSCSLPLKQLHLLHLQLSPCSVRQSCCQQTTFGGWLDNWLTVHSVRWEWMVVWLYLMSKV